MEIKETPPRPKRFRRKMSEEEKAEARRKRELGIFKKPGRKSYKEKMQSAIMGDEVMPDMPELNATVSVPSTPQEMHTLEQGSFEFPSTGPKLGSHEVTKETILKAAITRRENKRQKELEEKAKQEALEEIKKDAVVYIDEEDEDEEETVNEVADIEDEEVEEEDGEKKATKQHYPEEVKPHGTEYKRKCHTCGKPTNNYRCAECWRKLQGFAPQTKSSTREVAIGSSSGFRAGGSCGRHNKAE